MRTRRIRLFFLVKFENLLLGRKNRLHRTTPALFLDKLLLELVVGLEPTTCGLRNIEKK